MSDRPTGHPDAHVQRALDELEKALDRWSSREGGGVSMPGYVVALATKDHGGTFYRSVIQSDLTPEEGFGARGRLRALEVEE